MTNKYFSGRKGHYIFCDICGQACYGFEAVRLDEHTGRGGCIVCPADNDKIDFGLIPFSLPAEKGIKWTRINHQNQTNGSTPLDFENTAELGV